MQQFRQNGDDYFAITNNITLDPSGRSDKMIIYKIDNPSQVTCIFSQSEDLPCPTYMTLLPSLSEKTIRIQKTEFPAARAKLRAITSSVVEIDTESS